MIIRAPTGLFEKRLPKKPSDQAPVTWSISNQNPPPPAVVHSVVAPMSIVFAPDPPVEEQRSDYGELVFSVVVGKRSVAGSNKKAFEAGDIINFDDDESIISTSVPTNELTVQHNTNVLDLESLGLTAAEIALIVSKSDETLEEKRTLFVSLQTDISNLKIAIRENQKIINECNKAIKAVTVTFSGDTDETILEKLDAKLLELTTTRTTLNTQLTAKSVEFTQVQGEFIDISQVVR